MKEEWTLIYQTKTKRREYTLGSLDEVKTYMKLMYADDFRSGGVRKENAKDGEVDVYRIRAHLDDLYLVPYGIKGNATASVNMMMNSERSYSPARSLDELLGGGKF